MAYFANAVYLRHGGIRQNSAAEVIEEICDYIKLVRSEQVVDGAGMKVINDFADTVRSQPLLAPRTTASVITTLAATPNWIKTKATTTNISTILAAIAAPIAIATLTVIAKRKTATTTIPFQAASFTMPYALIGMAPK